MPDLGALRRTALLFLVLAAIPIAAGGAQAPAKAALGLCPAGVNRLDAYLQALCDGEAALQAGDFGAATERFRVAAALPRTDASNELAWAGLAVAHCRAGEGEAGRQWAAHFAQARQLWLGELDCAAAGDDPRAKVTFFVRSRMCTDPLAADYAAVRANPQSPQAAELRLRFRQIDDGIAAACSAKTAAPPQAGTKAGSEAAAKKASSKRSSRSKKPPKSG